MPHQDKKRYPLETAYRVAQDLKPLISPSLDRGKIAGSIRRKVAMVGDIELVVIPKTEAITAQLEGLGTSNQAPVRNMLKVRLQEMVDAGILQHRGTFGDANQYMRHVESDIPIDIFSTTELNWGMMYFVRTGPAEYIKNAMKQFLYLHRKGHAYGGVTLENGTTENCPEETKVFELLNWPFVIPERRG